MGKNNNKNVKVRHGGESSDDDIIPQARARATRPTAATKGEDSSDEENGVA